MLMGLSGWAQPVWEKSHSSWFELLLICFRRSSLCRKDRRTRGKTDMDAKRVWRGLCLATYVHFSDYAQNGIFRFEYWQSGWTAARFQITANAKMGSHFRYAKMVSVSVGKEVSYQKDNGP